MYMMKKTNQIYLYYFIPMWLFTINTDSWYKVVEIQSNYLDNAYYKLLEEVDGRFDIISVVYK